MVLLFSSFLLGIVCQTVGFAREISAMWSEAKFYRGIEQELLHVGVEPEVRGHCNQHWSSNLFSL